MKINKNDVNTWSMYILTEWNEIHLARRWDSDQWEDSVDFVQNMLLKLRLNFDDLPKPIGGFTVVVGGGPWRYYQEHATDVFLTADQDNGICFACCFRNEHFNGYPRGSWSIANSSSFSEKQKANLFNILADSWDLPQKECADLENAFHDMFYRGREDKEADDGRE